MQTPPSVVLFTVDCLRADHVGCYGYERPTTPHVDALADDATPFAHSYANSPGTRWALQTIHTGVHTGQIDGLGIPEGTPSLAEVFAEAGYTTGGFAKNGFLTRDYHYDRGFETFVGNADFAGERHPLKRAGSWFNDKIDSEALRSTVLQPLNDWLLSTEGDDDGYRPAITDEELCSLAIEWIADQRAAERPFFAWIHLMDAHTPYARWNNHLTALRGDEKVRHVIDPSEEVSVGTDPAEAVLDAYDAGIRSADEQIGRVLDTLGSDTVVAVTGDHGEEFGRYNSFHTASLHSSMTQVPLIVRAPTLDSGRTASPAQHLDIAPTLAEAAGIESPAVWEGRSLSSTDRDGDEPIYLAVSDERGVRASDWKLIRQASGDELYHSPHHGDDGGDVDVDHPDRRDGLAALLDDHEEWVTEHRVGTGEQDIADDAADLSKATRENLEELGYLER